MCVAAPQCISGRTSYLHVRLAFHPYPQLIPQFCNTGECEPRRPVTAASLCPWIAHVVSGRIAATPVARPLQTRFPCGSPPLAEVNQATSMHSPDHSTKGTPSALAWATQEWPLTAGEYVVSGSLSSPSRGTFHLSLTVLVHYRSLKVFSLGGWSPQLPTRFHVPRGTQDASRAFRLARYGSLTLCGGAFQHLRVRLLAVVLVLQPHRLLRAGGLGSSRFARHYYGNLA